MWYFLLTRHNTQYLIVRPYQLKRETLDIQYLAHHSNSKTIDNISSTLGCHGCLSGWLFCQLFSKAKRTDAGFVQIFILDSIRLKKAVKGLKKSG